MPATDVTLSAAEIETFQANGFLAIDRISSADEVVALQEIYADLLADPNGLKLTYQGEREDGTPGVITQVFAPELKRPEILDTEYIANGKRFAAALLAVDENDGRSGGVMFIYKPAGEGRDTPWHQDEAYWLDLDDVRCHSLSIWMPLDDVTVESGCMHYLPESHLGDVLNHVKVPGPEPLHLDPPVDTSAAVPCPIPAGGATIHHCRTVHFGGTNVSAVPR